MKTILMINFSVPLGGYRNSRVSESETKQNKIQFKNILRNYENYFGDSLLVNLLLMIYEPVVIF